MAKTSDYDESPGRYFKQKKSSHGKVAYIVYSGNEVGVFYNWYVFFFSVEHISKYLFPRTAASIAISGLEDDNKVYKGYSSYRDAHGAWDEFVNTGRLPGNVALLLGSKPYPVPPILPALPHPLVPPTTPQRVRAYNPHSASPMSPIPSQTLFAPRSGHAAATSSPSYAPASTGNHLNTPIVLPSTPPAPTSTQSRSAAALAIVLEEAHRANHEDFWVVFTGITPGVHQGRQVSIFVHSIQFYCIC